MTRSACGSTISRIAQAAAQAERVRRLELAALHREDAGAHDLGDERRGVDRQAEQQRGEFRASASRRPRS